MPQIKLLLDFDGTVTRHDTMAALANHVGYSRDTQRSLPPWSDFVDAYIEHKQALDEVYRDTPSVPTLDSAIKYQRRLLPVEEASHQRVMKGGIFDGVTKEDVNRGTWMAVESGDIEARDGLKQLLKYVKLNNRDHGGSSALQNNASIISVNWSTEWIRQIITVVLDSDDYAFGVHANELPSLGGTWPNICTSDQKLQAMQECCKGSSGALKVYVGDSMTDIECLLAADVGILIQDEPMRNGQKELVNVLDRGARSVVYIEDDKQPIQEPLEHKLIWARDFYQVARWLAWYLASDDGELVLREASSPSEDNAIATGRS